MLATVRRMLQAPFGEPATPPDSWFKDVQEFTAFTPDRWKLEQYQRVWLFCYGEEMYRHSKHSFIQDKALPLSTDKGNPGAITAFTYEKFLMANKKLGKESFPVAVSQLPCEDNHWFKVKNMPRTHIKGELYLVPPDVLFSLDFHRKNTVEFTRQLTRLVIPYKGIEHRNRYVPNTTLFQTLKAFTYMGIPEYWGDQIDMGLRTGQFTPVRSFRSGNPDWDKEYYFYTTVEAR